MRIRVIPLLIAMLFGSVAYAAPAPNELFLNVKPDRQARIVARDQEWFDYVTYYAKRWRLVRVNTELLSKDDDILVTAFRGPNADSSFTLKHKSHSVLENGNILWKGNLDETLTTHEIVIYEQAGRRIPTMGHPVMLLGIQMDVDRETGRAQLHGKAKRVHHEAWVVDDNYQVVLDTSQLSGPVGNISGPPETPEAIAHQKDLQRFRSKDFKAVADFRLTPRGGTPIFATVVRSAPRFMIVYTFDFDEAYRVQIDGEGGVSEVDNTRHAAHNVVIERRRKRDREVGMPVPLGDVQ